MRVDLYQSLNISVSRLCDVPSFAPALAEAHAREWRHLYAGWDRNAALADFLLERPEAGLPTTWVAHHPSGILMGSVSLVLDDLPGHPGLNPWLASLLVFPRFRGHGLGRVLTQKVLDFLHEHRYPHAFVFTEDQVPFFSKFGFSVHGPAQANGHPVTIMKWTNPGPRRLRSGDSR
jgi:predicted N-acetyltransferase YhbS